MRNRLTLLTLLMASACASTAGDAQRGLWYDPPFDENASQWEGWAVFSGEFKLYRRKTPGRRLTPGRCVSGALPLEAQRRAIREFEGRRVRVKGRAVRWPEHFSPDFLPRVDHGGSTISNWCFGNWVIFADSIEPLD